MHRGGVAPFWTAHRRGWGAHSLTYHLTICALDCCGRIARPVCPGSREILLRGRMNVAPNPWKGLHTRATWSFLADLASLVVPSQIGFGEDPTRTTPIRDAGFWPPLRREKRADPRGQADPSFWDLAPLPTASKARAHRNGIADLSDRNPVDRSRGWFRRPSEGRWPTSLANHGPPTETSELRDQARQAGAPAATGSRVFKVDPGHGGYCDDRN